MPSAARSKSAVAGHYARLAGRLAGFVTTGILGAAHPKPCELSDMADISAMRHQKSGHSCSTEIHIDRQLAFMLYVVGFNETELARKMGVSQQRVSQIARSNDWQAQRDMVLQERARKVGISASQEQEFIRSQEIHFARRLMGMAEQVMQSINLSKATIADLTKLVDLASRLGRLGSGLPLQPVELSVTHDISEDVRRMLDRAYGDSPAPLGDAKPIEAELVEQKPA